MLNKIKIGPKLIGGFLIVAVIAGVVGLLGIINMKSIADKDTYLYEKCTVPIEDLSNIAVPVQRMRVDLEDVLRSNDPKYIEAKKDRGHELRTAIDAGVKHYETTLLNQNDSQAYQVLKQEVANWYNAADKIFQLKEANKAADAYIFTDGEAYKTVSDLRAHVDSMITENVTAAKETSDNNTKTANSATLQMIIILIIGVAAALVIGLFLTFSITRPVNAVVTTAKKIAEEDLANINEVLTAASNGDLSKMVNVTAKELVIKSEDEIGILGEAFNQMIATLQQCGTGMSQMKSSLEQVSSETLMLAKAASEGQLATRGNVNKFNGTYREMVEGFNKTLDAVVEPINETNAVLQKVADRDLTVRVKGDYKGDMEKLKNAVNTSIDNLDSALQQVGTGTEQVSSASQQISAGSQSLAQGANEQASSLEEVSSSLEEMSSMTKQNAENANQAKGLAGKANDNAEQGKQAMDNMSQAINKIKESSDQTAKIIKTIDEIAMQTNLLALNAAVEAARAGEAGRGFAVVAEEVRNLAQRSAQAAKNTADMIEESVRNAQEGVKIAEDVSKSLVSIADGNKKVNDLIAEIAAASQEQSQGIDQVNTAVAQMDKVTQQNAANSEESASAAEELSSQAEELQNMVGQFKLSQQTSKAAMPDHPVTTTEKHPVWAAPAAQTFRAKSKNGTGKAIANRKNGNGKQYAIATANDIIPMDDDGLKEF